MAATEVTRLHGLPVIDLGGMVFGLEPKQYLDDQHHPNKVRVTVLQRLLPWLGTPAGTVVSTGDTKSASRLDTAVLFLVLHCSRAYSCARHHVVCPLVAVFAELG